MISVHACAYIGVDRLLLTVFNRNYNCCKIGYVKFTHNNKESFDNIKHKNCKLTIDGRDCPNNV